MAQAAESYAAEYLEGFPHAAAFISSSDDLAIFRCFKILATWNILYLQMELAPLEGQLKKIDDEEKAELQEARADFATARAVQGRSAEAWKEVIRAELVAKR